jgi:uncharacterized protein YacL
MQSNNHTHIEVLLNQIIGIIIGWLIVYLLFPLFDLLPQWEVATISSILFFVSSYARSYFIRRSYEYLSHHKKL